MILYIVHVQTKTVTKEDFQGKICHLPAGCSVFTESLMDSILAYVKENPEATKDQIAKALASASEFAYTDTTDGDD